jgi:signal transduction histidine kinase/DNA-binding response OmpR family regulator/tetratricopeptide (TPR) repeat protein
VAYFGQNIKIIAFAMKKKTLIILFYLLISLATYAQGKEDKTNQLLNKKALTKQVDLSNQRFKSVLNKNENKALDLCKKALEISEKIDYYEGALASLKNITLVYKKLSKLDSAIIVYQKYLSFLEEKPQSAIQGNFDLSQVYFDLSKDKESLECIEKGINIAQKFKKDEMLARGYVLLGNNFFYKKLHAESFKKYSQADSICLSNENLKTSSIRAKIFTYLGYSVRLTHGYDKSYEYYLKSKKMYETIQDSSGIREINTAIAQYLIKIEKYDEAEALLTDAINFYRDNPDIKIYTYAIILRAYMNSKKGDLTKAENDYKLYYDITSENENNELRLNALYYLGDFYFSSKRYDLAEKYLKLALALAFELNNLDQGKKITNDLILTYAEQNKTKKLVEQFKNYVQISDSLLQRQKDKEIFELEAKYQNEQKKREIEILNANTLAAEKQRQNQFNLFMGLTIVLILVLLMLYILYRNKQKIAHRLKELDIIKSNFFANISHEFRTPLTLIKEPIEELSSNGLSPEHINKLAIANRNADRLLELVDQLLDLSKLESGNMKLVIERQSVQSFLSSLIPSFRYSAEKKRINFITDLYDLKDYNYFDKDVLEKIIVNLMTNAIKYTPGNGVIKLSVFNKMNLLCLEVYNTGVGMSNEDKQKIYERFYQKDNEQPGVGIGLALTKELVLLHKGTINILSDEKSWVCFSVSIPGSKNSYSSGEISKQKKSDGKLNSGSYLESAHTATDVIDEVEINKSDQPILLIVEDNTDLRMILHDLFKNDFNIIACKDGLEGVEKAFNYIPDIIISDVMMPTKNGYELTIQLKSDVRTSHIPVILLTARSGEENELTGFETGADAYIVKPFNRKILKLQVKKLIELRKKLRQRYSQELILKPKDIAINTMDQKFLEKVEQLLDNQITNSDFTSEIFSRQIGMSRMQLHRKLKALTGLSTSAFIRSQRLKLAVKLLEKDSSNISDVAYAVGFNDLTYFIKCFKEVYKTTPKKYINKAS